MFNNAINARTKITGLFGYPVEHSLSPAMHNAGFNELELDFIYAAFSVHPDHLAQAVHGVRAMNFRGINVTIPHKEKVLVYLDEVNPEAKFIGAVNTILHEGNRLIGFNTDGKGFLKSLSEAEISIESKNIFIIGAGGASRAVSYYLSEKASNLWIHDIDAPKLTALVHDLQKIRKNVFAASDPAEIKNSDLIINATPLGLKEKDPVPLDLSQISAKQVVCDLIYKDTPLLAQSRDKGCKTLNGLGMLLWQGILAFEIWTGKKAPVAVMRRALEQGFRKQ
jgi:shikimate dehydrogenase